MRVVNVIMSGKLPFLRKITQEEVNEIISSGGWFLINEEHSPTLQKRVEFEDKGKHRKISACLSMEGSMMIAGLRRKKEGDNLYNDILNELSELIPKVIEGSAKINRANKPKSL